VIERTGSASPRARPRDLFLATGWGLLLWICVSLLATWSIDYGRHWDEGLALDCLQRSAVERSLLAHRYYYPSLMHDIALLSVLPEVGRVPVGEASTWTDEYRQGVLLRARSILAWITLFAVVIVAVFATYLTGTWRAAIPAGLLLAGSFEYLYHARWLAPDGLLATSAVLSLGLLVVARRRRSLSWLFAGAAVAGIACAAKYPGGVLLLPVLLSMRVMVPDGLRRRRGLQLVAVFFGVFILLTPGIYLDVDRFFTHVWFEVRHYAGGHGAYTTPSPLHHGGQLLWYLLAVFPSPFRWAALLATVPMVWGGIALWRRDREAFAVVGLTLLMYLGYFSIQKVMIVRNALMVMPVLAVLFAFGLHDFERRWGRRVWIAVVPALLVIATFNASWLVESSRSIVERRWSDPIAEFDEWVLDNPGLRLAATADVHRVLGAHAAELGVVERGPYDFAVSFQREFPAKSTVNVDGYVVFATGPREVNLDYYSSWESTDRIIVLDPDRGARRWPDDWLVVDR
jgi:hypothetical protein